MQDFAIYESFLGSQFFLIATFVFKVYMLTKNTIKFVISFIVSLLLKTLNLL